MTAVVVVLAGCTSEQPPSGDGGAATDAADTGSEDATDDGDQATEDDEPAVEPSGRLQLTGFRDDNPRGISVEVTSVEVDDAGHVALGFEAVHVVAGQGFVELGAFVVAIVDDLGNAYMVDRPEDPEAFRLYQDHRFTGTLAFHGPIDPDARRITLVINQNDVSERVDAASHEGVGRAPRFVVADIPLPGVGLEDEAVNPDALGVLESRTVEVGEEFVSPDNPDVTVTVVSVELDGRTVEIDLEAANRSGGEVLLLRQRPTLRDDTGRRFEFVSSPSEEREERLVELGPGEEASARFAFRGAPNPGASELRLVINPQPSGSTRIPMYEILLPLPAVDE